MNDTETLDPIDEDYLKNFRRLEELKHQIKDLEAEIAMINADAAETYPDGGYFTTSDGQIMVVRIRRDANAPRIDLDALQQIDPDLAGKVVTLSVDTRLVKKYIERGYFTDTPAAQALTVSYKRPWVQITPLANEENEETHE